MKVKPVKMGWLFNHHDPIPSGTGLTNFDPEDLPDFEAAIKEVGDDRFVIAHYPISVGCHPISSNFSLHFTGPRQDLGFFWEVYNRIRREKIQHGKEPS